MKAKQFILLAVLSFLAVTAVAQKTNPDGVLINGVVWATCNVAAPGTFAAKPEDPGMFYQWNRSTAWPATGKVTGWDATIPKGDKWTKANDPSPVGWRVPTLEEIKKLLTTDKVSSEWTTRNGITGMSFTDKTTGNSLFLPAVGYRLGSDGTLGNAGSSGYYWSSTQLGSDNAYILYFSSGSADWYFDNRNNGFSVRSVAE